MQPRLARLVRTALACVFSCVAALAASPIAPPVDIGDLPRDQLPLHDWWRDATWADPGGWKVVDAAAHGLAAGREDQDAAEIINRLFKETQGNVIVQLPAGTFTLRGALSFSRDGLRLRGAGREKTTLRFAAGIKGNAINLIGRQITDSGVILSAAPKAGDTTLAAVGAEKLAAGAHLWLTQAEPKSFGQLVRVAAIEGDRVTLDRALSLDFDQAQPVTVMLLEPRRDCAIEDLRVDRRDDPRESTLNLAYCANILLRGLELSYTEFAHVYLWRSQDVFIEDNIIHHSRHYGVGGSGYGVMTGAGSTRCLVRGNAIYYLRHATVFSGYACYNVVADNYLRSDQGHLDERHHGTFPFANLYEGNDALGIVADSRDKVNGPWNTHYRNRATEIEAGARNVCAKPPFFVVANLTSIEAAGTFAALNQVAGKLEAGALPASARLPASLYRTQPATRPAIPLIGPDSPDFGAARALPAEAWVPAIYRGGPETLVTIRAAAPDAAAHGGPANVLLPASLGATLPVKLAAAGGLACAARVSASGDRMHVLLENPTASPVRVRFAYDGLPAPFNSGLVRARFWQGPAKPAAPAADLESWRSHAEPGFTDFSPKTGHLVVVLPKTALLLELSNNTKRLARY